MERILLGLSLALSLSVTAFAKSPVIEEGYVVHDPSHAFYARMSQNPNWILDHVNSQGYEVYGPKGLGAEIAALATHRKLAFWPAGVSSEGAGYPSYVENTDKLKALVKLAPQIAKLVSVGKSVKGRELWAVKISDNVEQDETEPEFKYISSMHGDEITGRELMIRLVEDFIKGYDSNAEIKNLVDNTEIFIMPSMNPDGSEVPTRGNANGIDLNRDFPDFSTSDNKDDPTGRAIETQAIMKWQQERNFALSANFHGGAEVVNYPWDTLVTPFHLEALVVQLSLDYSERAPYIFKSKEFPKGITNGFAWYEVNGGMQDWSYYWYNDLQLTIELSNTKYPNFSKIPGYYDSNRAALIYYVSLVHMGAGVKLADAAQKGEVTVTQVTAKGEQKIGTYPVRNGEFYKVLEPGKYVFTITTDKTVTTKDVVVTEDTIAPNGNYIAP